ncbi:RYamide receptor-like [Saccoglossus kowalevskii]
MLTDSQEFDEYPGNKMSFPNYSVVNNESWYFAVYDSSYFKPLGIEDSGQLALITMYSVAALLALIGNVVVILVLCFSERNRTDLNKFLINLAVSDLTMAIFCIPFSFVQAMLGYWIFGKEMCKLVAFVQQVSVTVSIYTLTAIGIDRYFAVMYPMRKRLYKQSSKIAIILIWTVSLSLAIVQLVFVQAKQYQVSEETFMAICGERWTRDSTGIVYELFIFTIAYIIPLCVLGYTYTQVALRLWGRHIPGNADRTRDLTHAKSKRKVIKMLLLLVLLFCICWLPLNILNIVSRFRLKTINIGAVHISYFCAHWLAMSNSFVNPIVYGLLNDGFRTDLTRFIALCTHREQAFRFNLTFRSSTQALSIQSLPRSRSQMSSFSLRSFVSTNTTTSKLSSERCDNLTIKAFRDFEKVKFVRSQDPTQTVQQFD